MNEAYKLGISAKTQINNLVKSSNQPSTFKITQNEKKYQNIVVVIGESVSREYMSVYGYPLNTTPWLKNKNEGYFFTNYISAAPNTYMSLQRSLAMTNDRLNPLINNNIVELANKADYETYWVSNQGFLGDYDTPATIIAMSAKNKYFFKEGGYGDGNYDDNKLLDVFQKIMIKDKNKSKVIFLHMMGSHPDTCERLHGYPIKFNLNMNKDVNCYLSTLSKLDGFLKNVDSTLEKSHESYLMFYFSDHGLTIENSDKSVRHASDSKQNYNVPFFIFGSNIKEKIYIKNNISASNFINLFQHFTGIETINSPSISPYNLHKNSDITVYNGKNNISYSQLKDNKIHTK